MKRSEALLLTKAMQELATKLWNIAFDDKQTIICEEVQALKDFIHHVEECIEKRVAE